MASRVKIIFDKMKYCRIRNIASIYFVESNIEKKRKKLFETHEFAAYVSAFVPSGYPSVNCFKVRK